MRLFGRFRQRLLVHGLVIVLLMAGAVAAADRIFVNRWVEREIVERRARVNRAISVYDADGKLTATKVEPPVPAPSPDVLARLASGSPPIVEDDVVHSGVFNNGAFAGVVAREVPPPMESYPGPPLPLVLLVLGACMLVTLLASIPLSRTVVYPVEALARSVKRFGAGDLNVRAAVSRNDEIGDLAVAFNEMASRVEALMRSEKQLLADVSHELRTPLARMRVVLELASDGDSSEVQAYLPEIAQDLAELETLVDDVLASAQLEAAKGNGTLPVHRTPTSVARLLEKSSVRFVRLHPEQPFEVMVDVGELQLDCDPRLLRRALDNALDNAAKHAPGANVVLRATADHDGVRIDVIDDGPGMSEAATARAFEAFFRDDVSRDRRTGGVGLGLAIVRSVVEAHGGRVRATSAPGHGTTISIALPRSSD